MDIQQKISRTLDINNQRSPTIIFVDLVTAINNKDIFEMKSVCQTKTEVEVPWANKHTHKMSVLWPHEIL